MARNKDPEKELANRLSKQYGVPSVNLDSLEIGRDVLDLVPAELANRHRLLPINGDEETLVVAMADPSKVFVIDDIKTRTGREIEVCVAPSDALKRAINRYYFPN